MRSELAIPDDTEVEFQLLFELERQKLRGHGIVRWTCVGEQCIGVEIRSIKEGIEWIDNLARENTTVSFIPGSS